MLTCHSANNYRPIKDVAGDCDIRSLDNTWDCMDTTEPVKVTNTYDCRSDRTDRSSRSPYLTDKPRSRSHHPEPYKRRLCPGDMTVDRGLGPLRIGPRLLGDDTGGRAGELAEGRAGTERLTADYSDDPNAEPLNLVMHTRNTDRKNSVESNGKRDTVLNARCGTGTLELQNDGLFTTGKNSVCNGSSCRRNQAESRAENSILPQRCGCMTHSYSDKYSLERNNQTRRYSSPRCDGQQEREYRSPWSPHKVTKAIEEYLSAHDLHCNKAIYSAESSRKFELKPAVNCWPAVQSAYPAPLVSPIIVSDYVGLDKPVISPVAKPVIPTGNLRYLDPHTVVGGINRWSAKAVFTPAVGYTLQSPLAKPRTDDHPRLLNLAINTQSDIEQYSPSSHSSMSSNNSSPAIRRISPPPLIAAIPCLPPAAVTQAGWSPSSGIRTNVWPQNSGILRNGWMQNKTSPEGRIRFQTVPPEQAAPVIPGHGHHPESGAPIIHGHHPESAGPLIPGHHPHPELGAPVLQGHDPHPYWGSKLHRRRRSLLDYHRTDSYRVAVKTGEGPLREGSYKTGGARGGVARRRKYLHKKVINRYKDPNSYCAEIAAILLQHGSLPLAEIYDMYEGAGLHSKRPSTHSWKNSIRHNLSLHDCFVKIPSVGHGFNRWGVHHRWVRHFRQLFHRARGEAGGGAGGGAGDVGGGEDGGGEGGPKGLEIQEGLNGHCGLEGPQGPGDFGTPRGPEHLEISDSSGSMGSPEGSQNNSSEGLEIVNNGPDGPDGPQGSNSTGYEGPEGVMN